MLHEVSFCLTFASRESAMAVWNTVGTASAKTARTPEERPPAITAKSDDAFEVSAVMRFADVEDQTRLVDILRSAKGASLQGSPGHIRTHKCLHDEGKACIDLVSDRWIGGDKC